MLDINTYNKNEEELNLQYNSVNNDCNISGTNQYQILHLELIHLKLKVHHIPSIILDLIRTFRTDYIFSISGEYHYLLFLLFNGMYKTNERTSPGIYSNDPTYIMFKHTILSSSD